MRFAFVLFGLCCCSLSVCLAVDASTAGAESLPWYRPILDMGVAGSFIVYLIYDRHVERNRKDEENARWVKMDQTLLDMVAKATEANMEMAAALRELRTSDRDLCCEIQRLVTVMSTGRDYRRRAEDEE